MKTGDLVQYFIRDYQCALDFTNEDALSIDKEILEHDKNDFVSLKKYNRLLAEKEFHFTKKEIYEMIVRDLKEIKKTLKEKTT